MVVDDAVVVGCEAATPIVSVTVEFGATSVPTEGDTATTRPLSGSPAGSALVLIATFKPAACTSRGGVGFGLAHHRGNLDLLWPGGDREGDGRSRGRGPVGSEEMTWPAGTESEGTKVTSPTTKPASVNASVA